MFFKFRQEATIRCVVKFKGIGVHSGKDVTMKIIPAPNNLGIIFKRTDVSNKNPYISLSPESVVDPVFCTKVVNKDGVSVSVIEHLLAAMRISGISNALIELDEEEVPIIDGSAQIFVETFKKIGIVKQRSSIPAVIVKKQLIVKTSTGKIELKPFLRRRISVTINSDKINPVIGRNKTYTCNLDEDLENLSELATARTFGWIDDLETIRNKGFAAGASLDNTIGISKENKIINPEGLRNPKELVMHKCLDLIGDISVLGFDIIGEIKGYNISHQLNNLLMRKLIEEIDQHEIINERFAVKKSEIRPSFGT